jgi:hypothetical protein
MGFSRDSTLAERRTVPSETLYLSCSEILIAAFMKSRSIGRKIVAQLVEATTMGNEQEIFISLCVGWVRRLLAL